VEGPPAFSIVEARIAPELRSGSGAVARRFLAPGTPGTSTRGRILIWRRI